MEHASGHNPATRVIGGLVVVAAIVALCFQVKEPFEGRSLAYVGRLLGPVTIVLIGAHLFLQRRPHPLFGALLVVLSVLTLLLVVLGFRH
ncbi:MAG: hypothetical protein ABIT71_02595 [Vicinamibacteraceae bacterium]